MNHCVPLLDVLEESEESEVYYLVMPYLRPAHDPPLRTVGDAMDFTTQVLEVRQLCYFYPHRFMCSQTLGPCVYACQPNGNSVSAISIAIPYLVFAYTLARNLAVAVTVI